VIARSNEAAGSNSVCSYGLQSTRKDGVNATRVNGNREFAGKSASGEGGASNVTAVDNPGQGLEAELFQAGHHMVGSREYRGGCGVGNGNAKQSRLLRRMDTSCGILDDGAVISAKSVLPAFFQQTSKSQLVSLRVGFAVLHIIGCDHNGKGGFQEQRPQDQANIFV
jgi:hypothetical protein